MPESHDLSALRIGVLFGGDSPERPGSVASGEAACKALHAQGLTAELIDLRAIDWNGLADRIDVALLASHGLGGEDGKVQGALDLLGIRYTGSGVKASAVGMHKSTLKQTLAAERIDTPRWIDVHPEHSPETTMTSAAASLGFPVFLKPMSGGGSLAAGIASSRVELLALVNRTRGQAYGEFMVEEYVTGMPCTVGVLEIDGQLTTLPVHSVETDRPFYDYEAKHDLALRREACPAALPEFQTGRLQQIALRVHQLIGAHGVSRVDFLVEPSGRTPVLEINTVPGLSEHGNLATMAAAAGISYGGLIRHVLTTAFTKSAYVP